MTTKMTPREEPGYGLSALAQELLPVLYNHRLVSTSQLHQLLRPDNRDSRYLRRELCALRKRGLADATKRRRAGSGELLSYLTPLGASVVETSGEATPRSFRMSPQAAAGQLQEHTLAVVETGMAFLRAARGTNDQCGPLNWTPEISHRIRGGDDGTWDRAFLIPDSVLHYTRTSRGQRRLLTFFVEVDRATEPAATLVQKLAAYARYHSYTPATEPAGRGKARRAPASRPAWTERYPGAFPTVLIVLTGRSHRALIRRAGDVRALAAADPRLAGTDLRAGITTLEQLQTEGPWAPTVIPLLGEPAPTDVLLEPAAAGRRLGPGLYTGTMAAVVIGGAATIGGVRLGYTYGLSGAWMVFAIGFGLLALSIFFSARIARLRVYTVADMLSLRYGDSASIISGVVMWVYTLMLAVTSTIAYATVFDVLFDVPRWVAVVIGGTIVIGYSALGGMWSITLTDMVQFVIKSIGVFVILLPVAVVKAGGFAQLSSQLPDIYLSFGSIGGETVFTYVLIYTFGMLIGQDIWQRVFTARSDKVASWGGAAAGLYCLLYGLAGAVIGMATKVLHPDLASADNAFATVVQSTLPTGIKGLVLAAALSAMMSTASGALIASATVANNDIWRRLRALNGRAVHRQFNDHDEVANNRLAIVLLGALSMALSCLLDDVLAALTVAYNLLVGGLLVPILGGMLWKRGNLPGALAAMTAGGIIAIALMATQGMLANEPIYYGLAASLVAYVAVSLATRPTEARILEQWHRRLAGQAAEDPHDRPVTQPDTAATPL